MTTLAFIGSLGTPELLLIFGAVLLIFGPAAIPKLARSLGSGIREFKDAATKMSDTVMNDEEEDEPKKTTPPREVEGTTARSKTTAAKDQEEEKVSSNPSS